MLRDGPPITQRTSGLIASAKSTYDTRRNHLLQISTDIILLDRVLANYEAETKDA
jgi:hypothetical protein